MSAFKNLALYLNVTGVYLALTQNIIIQSSRQTKTENMKTEGAFIFFIFFTNN